MRTPHAHSRKTTNTYAHARHKGINEPLPLACCAGRWRNLPSALHAQPAIFPACCAGRWPNRPSSMGRLCRKKAGWATFLHNGPMEDGELGQVQVWASTQKDKQAHNNSKYKLEQSLDKYNFEPNLVRLVSAWRWIWWKSNTVGRKDHSSHIHHTVRHIWSLSERRGPQIIARAPKAPKSQRRMAARVAKRAKPMTRTKAQEKAATKVR